jgi:hypothetical protein
LTKFKIQGGAQKTTISGNPEDENNYDKQPIMPIKESVSIKSKFAEKIEPYSITMWTIQL